MFPEFTLEGDSNPPKPLTEEEKKQLDEVMSHVLREEDRARFERLLLERLKQRKPELAALWEKINGHWQYEDHFYRFYHGSFKVYSVQATTEKAVAFLRDLVPERRLNMAFERIIRDGTGKE